MKVLKRCFVTDVIEIHTMQGIAMQQQTIEVIILKNIDMCIVMCNRLTLIYSLFHLLMIL